MLHIKKSTNGKFFVLTTAENGEPLNTSEMLESKQACFGNIKASAKNFQLSDEGHYAYVKDETVKKPKVQLYDLNKKA